MYIDEVINEIFDIENIDNEEIKALFVEAENILKNNNKEDYIKALLNYDKIIVVGEKVNDYSVWSKAYFGMYLAWWKYCQQIKSSLTYNFINYATTYAILFEQAKLADKMWEVYEDIEYGCKRFKVRENSNK